ncbi:monoheme cytochrome C [Maribacter sp. MMG018]|uniref:monoheme cytochrome C n=1 Tax=Maribacter sp. MMG018 TaxID=2822688 RepID=UPI001B36B3D1|nr:monoheme cytochrome C [Maribacter sp. MMG018]MBQ4915225.1 monoheme cytochrome C [Maribacter sp. MMG018]
MEGKNNPAKNTSSKYKWPIVVAFLFLFIGTGVWYLVGPEESEEEVTDITEMDPDKVENGIHVRTGLIEAEGLQEVINNCTTCHSSKLIIQNRMGEEQWNSTIRWMQETQGLWDLGDNQKIIVDYLTTNYPPFKKGRRKALSNIEWYKLDQ